MRTERPTPMALAFIEAVGSPKSSYRLARKVVRVGSRKGAGMVPQPKHRKGPR